MSMRPFVESELLRTPLEEMCLMSKKLGLAPGGPEDDDGIPAFLSKAMTPPHEKSITNALELLVDLGAMLPETNDLTTLGECLSVLSLEPRVGKMVIWSYLLGCTRAASQMAVAMSYKSPFVLPPPSMRRDAETAQLKLSDYSESDQVTVFNAIMKRDQLKKKSGEGAYRDWCRRNYVSPSTLQMISDLRRNLSRELSSLGYADPMTNGYHNRHDKQHALWQAAIAAGLYPNVATRQRGDVNFSTMTNRKAKIHVSSVNAVKGQPLNSKCQIPAGEIEFVCFGEMVKGSHFFTLSQTTHLPSPLPLLLLCGTSLSIHPANDENGNYSVLNLDDWIIFQCRTDVASRLVVLRKRLESAFWNAVSDPRSGTRGLTPTEQDAIETLGTVLKSAFKSSAVR
jgi:Helicase associated domain (HA2)/Oligonucleotide/oligosaccharide-binding (OB)-fold